MAELIVITIIVVVICFQIKFFLSNRRRMKEFRMIFNNKSTWELRKNNNDFVTGINGEGNKIFKGILTSINRYLYNCVGSSIDFWLLKDAVDRHCDSVEDEISTQMPVPLYCGLAGTMLGVIVGLGSLLLTGSIPELLGAHGSSINLGGAAIGVTDLLTGVAIAMVASVIGILLTTFNSQTFKKCKSDEESGKNEFLAWMQSRLLPELPTDTSQALTKLVNNLNRFNITFKENTEALGEKLLEVNKSYDTQAEVIRMIHDMDVQKMARANVKVLDHLQNCTEELAQFQEYLSSVKGYTRKISELAQHFDTQNENLHNDVTRILEEHKAILTKELANQDNTLKEEIGEMKNTSAESLNKLEQVLIEQSDHFKKTNEKLLDSFTNKLSSFPQVADRLDEISKIPEELKNLINKTQQSNKDFLNAIQQKIDSKKNDQSTGEPINVYIPKKMQLFAWVVGIVVIVASLLLISTITYMWLDNDNSTEQIDTEQTNTDIKQSLNMANDCYFSHNTISLIESNGKAFATIRN